MGTIIGSSAIRVASTKAPGWSGPGDVSVRLSAVLLIPSGAITTGVCNRWLINLYYVERFSSFAQVCKIRRNNIQSNTIGFWLIKLVANGCPI